MVYIRASQKKDNTAQRKQHPPMTNPKTTKQLLGELFEDRAFLEKIITNTSTNFSFIHLISFKYDLKFEAVTKPNTKSGDAIYQLASDGIDYLDSRTHFWRQQEPLYARYRFIKKPEGDEESYKHIRRELEAIDDRKF